MTTIIVTAEFISALYMLIILASVISEKYTHHTKRKFFIYLTCTIMIALLLDACSWLLDPHPMLSGLAYVVDTLSIIVAPFEASFLAYYMISHINIKQKFTYWWAHGIAIFNALLLIGTIIAACTGVLFTLENGVFIPGPYYAVTETLSIVPIIILLILAIYKHKVIGTRDTIAFTIYAALPLFTLMLEFLIEMFEFSYIASGLSLAICYTLLQSHEISFAKEQERISSEASKLDFLTGLQNRRAFTLYVEGLGTEGTLGIAFCDLNGLKYTNDQFGHEAGDNFIKNFVEIMSNEFPYETMFRVSGDEFLIVLPDITEATFQKQIERFRMLIGSHGQIASIGYAHGAKSEIEKLLSSSEHNMYEEKNAYYTRTGKDRRS